LKIKTVLRTGRLLDYSLYCYEFKCFCNRTIHP